jgi:hypothetical protein
VGGLRSEEYPCITQQRNNSKIRNLLRLLIVRTLHFVDTDFWKIKKCVAYDSVIERAICQSKGNQYCKVIRCCLLPIWVPNGLHIAVLSAKILCPLLQFLFLALNSLTSSGLDTSMLLRTVASAIACFWQYIMNCVMFPFRIGGSDLGWCVGRNPLIFTLNVPD